MTVLRQPVSRERTQQIGTEKKALHKWENKHGPWEPPKVELPWSLISCCLSFSSLNLLFPAVKEKVSVLCLLNSPNMVVDKAQKSTVLEQRQEEGESTHRILGKSISQQCMWPKLENHNQDLDTSQGTINTDNPQERGQVWGWRRNERYKLEQHKIPPQVTTPTYQNIQKRDSGYKIKDTMWLTGDEKNTSKMSMCYA